MLIAWGILSGEKDCNCCPTKQEPQGENCQVKSSKSSWDFLQVKTIQVLCSNKRPNWIMSFCPKGRSEDTDGCRLHLGKKHFSAKFFTHLILSLVFLHQAQRAQRHESEANLSLQLIYKKKNHYVITGGWERQEELAYLQFGFHPQVGDCSSSDWRPPEPLKGLKGLKDTKPGTD